VDQTLGAHLVGDRVGEPGGARDRRGGRDTEADPAGGRGREGHRGDRLTPAAEE
jgi:hypothetical protein